MYLCDPDVCVCAFFISHVFVTKQEPASMTVIFWGFVSSFVPGIIIKAHTEVSVDCAMNLFKLQ